MRTRFLPVWFLAVALIGVGLWQGTHDAARAATYYVTNNLDSGAGSLRNAVAAATSGSDSISIVTPGPININSPINISNSVTINGPAIAVNPSLDPTSVSPSQSGQVAIVSGGSGSVFYISSGNVTLTHLYITGGAALGTSQSAGNGDDAMGGGIYNAGTLSLDYCTLYKNNALGGNGPLGGGDAFGGAIASSGTLTINHSTIKNNNAVAGTGANAGGAFNHAYGGGVYSTGSTTIINSTFNNNTAQGGNGSTTGGIAEGGGLSVNSPGSLSITNSTFNANQVKGGTGGTVGGNVYGGAVSATVPFTPLIDTTVVGNTAMSGGGGSAYGSGVYYFYNSAQLVVENCIIANNSGAGNDLDATPSFNALGSPGVNIAPASVTIDPLASNGGPTETMSSTDGTYVVDVGDFGLAAPPISLDQRGAPRVAGGAQDAGAMENNSIVPTNTAPTTTPFTFQLVNGTVNFSAQQFKDAVTYPDPNDSLQSVVISNIQGGTLTLNGQPVTNGSVISVADLDNLKLTQTDPNTPTSFSWTPSDGTNTVPGITVSAGEQDTEPPYVDVAISQGHDNYPNLGTSGIADPKITQGPPSDTIIYTDSAVSFTAKAQSVVPYNTVAPSPPATTPALDPTRSVTLTVTETVLNNNRITGSTTYSNQASSSTTTAYVSVPCAGINQPGLHVISVTAVNGHNVSTTYTTSFLVDQIPVISNQNTISSPQSINLGDTFSQELDATDPDYYVPYSSTTPDQLKFRVDQLCYGTGGTCDSTNNASNIGSFSDSNLTGRLPNGSTLTTTFNWKPTQVGKYNLKVTLTDYWGYNDASFNFTVIVNPPANQPPVIVNPGTLTAVTGTNFNQQISVTDAENDPLTYNISGLPPGLIMTPTASGVTISGIPTTNANSPYSVTLSASDGNHTTPTTATFLINVKDVGAPVINNILVNGTALSSPVNVAANQDFNGLQATAQVNNYPDNLTFLTYEGTLANTVGSWNVTNTTGSVGSNLTTTTAAFSWPNVPAGIHVVTVRVTAQNGEYDERQFTIQAGNAPTLSLNPSAPISVTAGQPVSIAATSQDSDANETLTFSVNGAPTGVGFSGQSVFTNVPSNTNETATVQWTPTAAQIGSYTFNVVVTDAAGLQATVPITVNVDPAPPNLPPTVQNPGPQTVNVGENANIQIVANDPENAPLTYTSPNLPGWASLDASTGLISHAPGVGDVATTNVIINVSDGVNTVSTTFPLTVVQAANLPPVVSNPGTWILSARTDNTLGPDGTLSIFATDPENGPLTYTPSANMPAWVQFQPPTSAGIILYGTPHAGDVGITNVTVNVSDGVNTVPVNFQIDVVAPGFPTLQATPTAPANPEQLKLGDGYSKIFLATDTAYPETLTFSAVVTNMADNSIVNGATFLPMYESGSASAGTTKAEAFQWTPTASGTYKVVVTVTDGNGNATSLTFSIHVDSPPSISITPSTLSATPELPLSIPVNVTDGDPNETLSLSLGTGAPTGMSFNGLGTFVNVPANTTQTAQLTWTPADTDANTTYTFNVIVTDSGGQTATQSVTINVGAINGRPTITNPGTITVIKTHQVQIPITATDPEGDPLTYHVSSSPSGLGLSIDSNGVINGTVSGAVGTYQETVTADDGYHVPPAASMTFTIIVKAAAANSAPVWQSVPNQTVSVGQNVSINLAPYVSDPDHDTVTITDPSNSLVPSGLTIDSTGLITGTPTTPNVGNYTISITADDGYHGTTITTFSLTVQPNQPPFSRTLSDYNLYVGNNLYVDASTTDPEGDTITYGTTAPLPFGATINPSTGIISGTAATPYGSFPVSVTATDLTGSGHTTTYPPFTINVLSPFTVGFANSGNGYATITYTLLNNTNAAITPTVTGSLTGAGYTDNANAFFVASQGTVSDQWANPIIQRKLDPTKDTRILTWALGSLAPGNSATLTISVPVNANTPTTQELTNQWTAQYGAVTLNLSPVTVLTAPVPTP